jgi:hypothetical protein
MDWLNRCRVERRSVVWRTAEPQRMVAMDASVSPGRASRFQSNAAVMRGESLRGRVESTRRSPFCAVESVRGPRQRFDGATAAQLSLAYT